MTRTQNPSARSSVWIEHQASNLDGSPDATEAEAEFAANDLCPPAAPAENFAPANGPHTTAPVQNAVLVAIIRQLQALISADTRAPFSCAIDQYEAARVTEHHLKPATIVEYKRSLDRIRKDLGALPLPAVTEETVQDHLSKIRPTILPSHFSVFSACFRWLDRHGYPGLASLVPEKRPKRRNYRLALTDDEYRQLWEGLDEAERRPKARGYVLDAIRIGVLVPLRRSEIVTLRHDEIDHVNHRLILDDTKTGDRIIPVPPIAMQILQRQRKASSPYLFVGRQGRGHLHGSSLHHAWARILKQLDMRPLKFHSLRHSWASRAVREGVPLEIVRRVMGHSTEWMSSQYAHIGVDAARKSVEQLERLIVSTPIQMRLVK